MRNARRATVVLAASLAVGAVAIPALAAAVAQATAAPTSVSVLSYGAQARAEGAGPSTGPYEFDMPQGNTVQLFRVHNTGTVPLTAQTYRATGTALLPILVPEVALEACVGGTFSNTNRNGTCSGALIELTTTRDGAQSAALAVPVGGSVLVRARYVSAFNVQNISVRVDVTVARSQARAATTTSS